MNNYNSLWRLLLVILLMVIVLVVCHHPPSKTNTPGNTPVSSDNSNLLLGNPTNATQNSSNAANFLIDHGYYIESYNKATGIPNWVSWHIGASDLGSIDRLNDFRPDNNLPGGWYDVTPDDYRGSGFDKGHNCPSGDRTASQDANSATFLMDNMIPQAPRNNEQTWEHFESYCRDKVKNGNEVYVVMGNYGRGGTGREGFRETIGNGNVVVPAHIWKVAVFLPNGNNDLARINGNTRIIAIDTPNDNSLSPNWMTYVTTVADIETACHCNLLSALPQNIQNQLQSKKFSGGN